LALKVTWPFLRISPNMPPASTKSRPTPTVSTGRSATAAMAARFQARWLSATYTTCTSPSSCRSVRIASPDAGAMLFKASARTMTGRPSTKPARSHNCRNAAADPGVPSTAMTYGCVAASAIAGHREYRMKLIT
jgi:hypothetical protein